MRSLQTELKRLGIAKSAPSRRKQPRNVKDWQSTYDWSEVETELLESQAQGQETGPARPQERMRWSSEVYISAPWSG